MKRIEKIYSFVKKNTDISKLQKSENSTAAIGISSIDVSNALGTQRSNTSFDLNKLYKEKKLIKITALSNILIQKIFSKGSLILVLSTVDPNQKQEDRFAFKTSETILF